MVKTKENGKGTHLFEECMKRKGDTPLRGMSPGNKIGDKNECRI